MIYINTQTDFDRLLESVKESKYSISIDGALMHMYDEQCFLNAINRAITLEAKSILKENQTLDGIKDAYNSKNWFKLIFKLIDALIAIIAKGIRVLASIVKKFLYRSSDINKSNAEFMLKYGKALKAIGNYTVSIDGYNMEKDLTGMAMSIENSSDSFYRDAVISITGGNPVFVGRDAFLDKIAENRSAMLNSIEYNTTTETLKKDREWQSEVRYACFGEKRKYTYEVDNALKTISEFNHNKDFVRKLSEKANTNCNEDIEALNNVKKIMSNSTEYSNSNELVEQFKILNRYRTQTMQDTIYLFTTLMEYIDTINRQAKSICIIAMQEN